MDHRPTPSVGHISFDPDRDVNCATCGYNLRGTSGTNCPECGVGFELAGPDHRETYLIYLVALACTSGLAFVSQYIIFLIADLFIDPSSVVSMYGAYEVITYGINFLALPYLVVLLILRKRIVRASTVVQIAWAVAPVLGVLAELLYSLYSLINYY